VFCIVVLVAGGPRRTLLVFYIDISSGWTGMVGTKLSRMVLDPAGQFARHVEDLGLHLQSCWG